MIEPLFKGDGPLATAEREAAERVRWEKMRLEEEQRRIASQLRELQQIPFHHVAVSISVDDAGTADEYRRVDTVRFTCTAPADAACRTYPENCDCERWYYDAAGVPDDAGHIRASGQPCWLTDWFESGMAVYVAADYDDMRDDAVPAIERSGNITISYGDEWPEWQFVETEGAAS